MRVIDMHAHIFPDRVAAKATAATARHLGLSQPPSCSGSVGELLRAMDTAGIDYAMVFSAATSARQVGPVNRYIWGEAQERPRLIPCGTLHAGYEDYREELSWLREHGVHGIKLHPEFQHFALDDPRLFPMFEEMERTDMFLIAHMGYPGLDLSGPDHMIPIAETFPKLRCIAAHLGDWGSWDARRIRPLAKLPNVYADISASFCCGADWGPIGAVLREYDPAHVFFGSDFPIWSPAQELERVKTLELEEAFLEDLLFRNFARFYHYRTL